MPKITLYPSEAVTITLLLQPESVKSRLRSCGYRPDLLRSDIVVSENTTVALAAFAQYPTDSRSACIAVVAETPEPRKSVESCRQLGAPIVFVCHQNTLQWWRQGPTSAERLESVREESLDDFFRVHQDDFSPEAVYRAKTLGRVRSEYQLSFVDLGLLPLVEGDVGEALSNLISQNVSRLKKQIGWEIVTSKQGHWLLQTVFWLVSAKILHDKEVPGFLSIDLGNIENVFKRVAKHYGAEPVAIGSARQLDALIEAATVIDQFSSLSLATTESLAHVYENTLISKQTRAELGTHGTPSYLVDYIVGNLSDWIEEIPENDRSVFEPACGHAGFLVSAMRLLTQLLPFEKQVPSRRGPYLRKRLHGTDIDAFALELARLSLTLTDIPNPDGWDLRLEDMFVGDRLHEQSIGNTILLANPPFENFSEAEITKYAKRDSVVEVNNKAAEMLRRTLPSLKAGSVFGVVVPQTLLHGSMARDVRQLLVQNFELREVSLFPDSVFTFADAESAVLLGRRIPERSQNKATVRFQRVREWQMPGFRERFELSSSRTVEQNRFNEAGHWSLRVPDLEQVWMALESNDRASDWAEIGQGLQYLGKDLPEGADTYSDVRFSDSVLGFVRFEPESLELHQLPTAYWLNVDREVIRRPGTGMTTGVKQVLLNYARVSRGPWRLKALMDGNGRPVTSRFLTFRPIKCSLSVLWGILNSQVANAYVFCHLTKRDNIAGDIRKMPMPNIKFLREIERAADDYLLAARGGEEASDLEWKMARVDAAVLCGYGLPLQLENQVLSLFKGWERVGVPFKQSRFLPVELDGKLRYSDFVAYEQSWPNANRRRGDLIEKMIAASLTELEQVELDGLQDYADYYLNKTTPRSIPPLEELEDLVFANSPRPSKDS